MKNVAFLIALLIFMCSCGLYRQNAVNVPMLRQKGQINALVLLHANGLEGQVAAAAGNATGIMLNYSNLGGLKKNADEPLEHHTQQFAEMGLGIYQNGQKSLQRIRELFLLGGYGKSSIYREGLAGTHLEQASYLRLGLQADIGREKGSFSYAFSPALYFLHFRKLVDTDNLISADAEPDFMLSQVAFSASYRLFKPLSLFGQCAISVPLTTYPLFEKYNRYADFSPFNLGAGIRFRFR